MHILFLLLAIPFAPSDTLPVTRTIDDYRNQVFADPVKKMVDLKKTVPGIVLDLRYGTRNNFTKTVLYASAPTTFMRLQPAQALTRVQQALAVRGYGIKVFDAYRPHAATRKMWELVKDERYVANPAKGSNHNRGLAIDLTLIHLSTGKELDMGTGFDNFTDTAHHSFTALSNSILENRKLLKKLMEEQGFKSFDTEWWHYSWSNDRNYEVLDINLKRMKKAL
jgi:zinc D-Ala-D-Ala dipeptidase